ncbi:hypothetical protein N7489_004324 [Penicillium chrysogenum]|uniref:Uncharacterized protein n=1 Tax=Penicillium chrysogenum TaxID=5076 RepID=A0ABQ8WR41_PENCH|nr:uncharacterized protein N7489_004324 [Penicillium chrysogenum]KAJ5244228.1 hypothetical protein N7489_004324 [Penicillium chrysogenum]KAJ5275147.1 hypothetical protein N7505_003692 [Penicillium chrysogenum]KAJ5285640.1 hypothetical protein N7524_000946 [Penicillium chrysogenum]KAJ6156874.1 hypothetical protein N7497_005759 [Penicillium chrysogenum]
MTRKIGPMSSMFLSGIILLWVPSCYWHLPGTWYVCPELQKRNAMFCLIGSIPSGFGGVLA